MDAPDISGGSSRSEDGLRREKKGGGGEDDETGAAVDDRTTNEDCYDACLFSLRLAETLQQCVSAAVLNDALFDATSHNWFAVKVQNTPNVEAARETTVEVLWVGYENKKIQRPLVAQLLALPPRLWTASDLDTCSRRGRCCLLGLSLHEHLLIIAVCCNCVLIRGFRFRRRSGAAGLLLRVDKSASVIRCTPRGLLPHPGPARVAVRSCKLFNCEASQPCHPNVKP